MPRRMKDSGLQWVGKIPAEWEVKRGKYFLRLLARPTREEDGVITCFRDGEVTLRTNRREEGFTISLKECGYQGVEPGDLVVHGMDGFAGSIGISDSRGKASPVLNVLDADANKRFVMYFLRGLAYRDVFSALSTGIRVRSCDLRWKKLADLSYLLPPLPEQEAIAAFLDSVTGKIDELRGKLKREIDRLEDYKKSAITKAVCHGLDPKAKMKDSGVAWCPKVPEGWDARRVGLTMVERTARSASGKEEPLSMSQKLGIVPSKEIEVANPASSYVGAKLVCVGDLVLNKLKAHLGVFAISKYDGLVSPDYSVYRVNQTTSKEYLNFLFHTPSCISEFRRRITGVAVGFNRLYTSELFKVKIPFPPLPAQREIAAHIDTMVGRVNAIIEKRKRQLDALDKLKRTVVYDYVTGKREVPR